MALETGIEVYLRLNADDSNIDNISDLSNLLKTKLGEFDIEVVHNGAYDLVFYNGQKVK